MSKKLANLKLKSMLITTNPCKLRGLRASVSRKKVLGFHVPGTDEASILIKYKKNLDKPY